jgi:GxxExxY protein
MNTDKASLLLSERIIGCAFTVSNTLGSGFLEKVYEDALAHELRKAGLAVLQQHPVTFYCDGVVVGAYTADLLVENTTPVEFRAVKALDAIHSAQCLSLPQGNRHPATPAIAFR